MVLSGYSVAIREGLQAVTVDSCSGLNDNGAGVIVSGSQGLRVAGSQPDPDRVTQSNQVRTLTGIQPGTTQPNDPGERLQPNGCKPNERPNDYTRTNVPGRTIFR